MLRINRRTDYAIRSLLLLAMQPPGTRLRTRDIQTEMDIPRAYLQRIVAELVQHGFINATPGPKGGLDLSIEPADLSLLTIVAAFNGPVVVAECLENEHFCARPPRCPVHHRWSSLQQLIRTHLQEVTLAQLALEEQNNREALPEDLIPIQVI